MKLKNMKQYLILAAIFSAILAAGSWLNSAARNLNSTAVPEQAANPYNDDSTSNRQAIDIYYAAMTKGDFKAAESVLSDEFVLYEADSMPYAGEYKGQSGFRSFLKKFGDAWKEASFTDAKITSSTSGDFFMVTGRFAAKTHQDKVVSMPIAETVTVRGGKFIEMRPFYYDTAQIEKVFSTRPVIDDQNFKVAENSFKLLKEALRNGDYEPFLATLDENASYWFPAGEARGEIKGKKNLRQLYGYINKALGGAPINVDETMRVTGGGNTVVFEFADSAIIKGEQYRNRVAFSFDVQDGKIISYREYIGDISPTFLKMAGIK